MNVFYVLLLVMQLSDGNRLTKSFIEPSKESCQAQAKSMGEQASKTEGVAGVAAMCLQFGDPGEKGA